MQAKRVMATLTLVGALTVLLITSSQATVRPSHGVRGSDPIDPLDGLSWPAVAPAVRAPESF